MRDQNGNEAHCPILNVKTKNDCLQGMRTTLVIFPCDRYVSPIFIKSPTLVIFVEMMDSSALVCN